MHYCCNTFTCIAANIDESLNAQLPLEKAIQELALRKAKAVLQQYPDALVIGCDTIVVCDNNVMGKPKNKGEARTMLTRLSGHQHRVLTGVAFASSKKETTYVSVSTVTFQPLTAEEIEDYINSDEPYDKAGAYGIQGKAGLWITNIDGDYYSIMGLPINVIYNELKSKESYE